MPTRDTGTDTTVRLAIDTIKTLSIDAVEQAKSGHPGLPMGAADYAFYLWTRHLRFDPQAPDWPDRDRFVLSAGHGSMLLYSLLHLSGYDLPLDELKRFRQWESRTPGHPEYGVTPGVETTTGPLGQGFGNAVGLALAAKMAQARFNTASFRVVDHRVWVIASDGDMMEGVQSESASLAAHLGLDNLKVIYDDNHITIEGKTDLAFSEDVARRYEAYGWAVQKIDGHDHGQIQAALAAAERTTDRPCLIVARTHIAHGSPNKHDSAKAHGEPLGPEEAAATKKAIGWPDQPAFYVPDEARRPFEQAAAAGRRAHEEWRRGFEAWGRDNAGRRALWESWHGRVVPKDLFARLLEAVRPAQGQAAKPEATRVSSGKVMQAAAAVIPSLCGGSADLEPSTKTYIKDSPSIARGAFDGRNLHFGIREHAMGSVLNGMALYGGPIPYGATFLIFSDYMRPPMRLAAMNGLQTIYVFTHDSVFLGEDGPTHQPIEQLPGLRLVPNLRVLRPADALETAAAWALALERRDGPTALILTRQDVPPLARRPGFSPDDMRRGGYVVSETPGRTGVTFIATGSEVAPSIEALGLLAQRGIGGRVVSMPCPEMFLEQDAAYRASVVPDSGPIVVVEAARPAGWERIAGRGALLIGLDRYGASAPWKVIADKLGFTGPRIAERVLRFLGAD